MSTAFETGLAQVLKYEGGFVNDPRDPGGMTNLGVTRRVWEGWTHKPTCEADMRALKPANVSPLYRVQYWNAVSGDQLPGAIAFCVFDFAVNAGVNRAARYVQRIVGVNEDGHIGPATLAALDKWLTKHSVAEFVKQYADTKRAFYKALPTFDRFGKGWLNRVAEVETAAKAIMA